MNWAIKFARSVDIDLQAIDRPTRERIRTFLEQRVAALEDPRSTGKPLKGELCEYWRYRVGHYRVICEIRDETIVVLVLRVGHRKEIYR